MPSMSELKHYRLVAWELSKPVHNEMLDIDPAYTIEGVGDREYRYECSILRCRSLWDLRMTPSGLFCEAHYLPWLHRDSNGDTISLGICHVEGCMEPAVSKRGKCRFHSIGEISNQDVHEMAEMLISLNRDNPHICGSQISIYSRREKLQTFA